MSAAAVAAIPFLLAGAVCDWRTRTAPNVLWLVTTMLSLAALWGLDPGRLASGVLMLGIGWAMYRSAAFGGADAKTVMTTGALYATPIEAVLVLLAAILGTLPWAALVGRKRIPFLIPLATAATTWIVLASCIVALPAALQWEWVSVPGRIGILFGCTIINSCAGLPTYLWLCLTSCVT